MLHNVIMLHVYIFRESSFVALFYFIFTVLPVISICYDILPGFIVIFIRYGIYPALWYVCWIDTFKYYFLLSFYRIIAGGDRQME